MARARWLTVQRGVAAAVAIPLATLLTWYGWTLVDAAIGCDGFSVWSLVPLGDHSQVDLPSRLGTTDYVASGTVLELTRRERERFPDKFLQLEVTRLHASTPEAAFPNDEPRVLTLARPSDVCPAPGTRVTVFVTVLNSDPPDEDVPWIVLAIDDAGTVLHDAPELSALVAAAVGDADTTQERVARLLELTEHLRP